MLPLKKQFSTKLLFLFFLLASQQTIYAQSIKSKVVDLIEKKISTDSYSWKASEFINGTVEILDAESNSNNTISIKGTFKVRVKTILLKSTETITFRGTIKQIFDDFDVTCLYWTQPYLGSTYIIGNCN